MPFHLQKLDEGNGIEMTTITNSAQYHQSCTRLKFNNTKLQRADRRVKMKDSKEHNSQMEFTQTRSKSAEKIVITDVCFFCRNPPGNSVIHQAATFQVNEHVRVCAILPEDTDLLAKLSTTDMVALDAEYHTKCLVDLFNQARKAKANGCKDIDEMEMISRIVFVELVLYTDEVHHHDVERAAVFKLSDLAQLYTT